MPLKFSLKTPPKMVLVIPLNTKNEDQTLRLHRNFAFAYTMRWKLLGSVNDQWI